MKKIIVRLDYQSGPVWRNFWKPSNQKRLFTGIDRVDTDECLINLNEEAQNLYASYFSFDKDGETCVFNTDMEKESKEKMLTLLKKIISRLNYLNEGDYLVFDEETERIKKL